MKTQIKSVLLVTALVLSLILAMSAHLEGVCEPQILCMLALHQTLLIGGSTFKRFQLSLEAFLMSQMPLVVGNFFNRLFHLDGIRTPPASKF